MPMSNEGLTKLTEECGELVQIASKLIAYPSGEHPDGKGNLLIRLEEELADVQAAMALVIHLKKLDRAAITKRADYKIQLFIQWEQESL